VSRRKLWISRPKNLTQRLKSNIVVFVIKITITTIPTSHSLIITQSLFRHSHHKSVIKYSHLIKWKIVSSSPRVAPFWCGALDKQGTETTIIRSHAIIILHDLTALISRASMLQCIHLGYQSAIKQLHRDQFSSYSRSWSVCFAQSVVNLTIIFRVIITIIVVVIELVRSSSWW